jgi:hypothetical protein
MGDMGLWILVVWLIIFWWGVVSLLVKYLRHRNRLKLREIVHKERMTAIEKGVPLPELPEVTLEHLQDEEIWRGSIIGNQQMRKLALALGLVLLFGGIGVSLTFAALPDNFKIETFGLRGGEAFGIIPVMIGIGLLIYYRLTKEPNQKAKKEQQD